VHLIQEQTAETVGKDRTTIANTIRLLRRPEKDRERLVAEDITYGHARALINLPSEQVQVELLNKIIDKSLSVRKVEQLVRNYNESSGKELKRKTATIKTRINTDDANLGNIEDKLRKIFGTKVICRQKKDGSGELIIEYYSSEELERLFELFEIIDKNYN